MRSLVSVEARPDSPSFRIAPVAHEPTRIAVQGVLRFDELPALWDALCAVRSELTGRGAGPSAATTIDVSGVSQADASSVALLCSLRAQLTRAGAAAEFAGAEDGLAELLRLYGGDAPVERKKRRRPRGALDQLGSATLDVLSELKQSLSFVGELARSSLGAFLRPRTVRWADLPLVMERTGADAVVIVVMINFLVGLVMAYQASPQLKTLGANHLVANLLGISMTRELGPLMTAIVVCGRSGAALAAELGSMNVNEEIDALRTMGMSAHRFIVLPRALGMALVMPVLTLFADAMGILGGLVIGIHVLGLTSRAYLHQLESAVSTWDVASGALKSVVFGAAIALIAAQQGLSATGGAEGVGRRTTSAVVTTLFALILIDASFTIMLRSVGL